MTEFSLHSSEFDLSGGEETPQNNVCVALETMDGDPEPVSGPEVTANSMVYSLLRGRSAERKTSAAAADDAMIFKLLGLNELDQAIVNISYYFDIRSIVPDSALGSFKITGLEEAGLKYNPKTFTIEGVPNRLGTFQVAMQFNIKGSPFSKMVNLRVITLWKDVDPPADLVYPKSNSDSASLIVDMYRKRGLKNVVAASQRGRSHAYDGKPRDDDFAIYHDRKSLWYVCAVADGAGSARYSREGSRILAHQVRLVFEKVFADPEFNTAVLSVVDRYGHDCDVDAFYRDAAALMVSPIRQVLTGTLEEIENRTEILENSRMYDFSTTCLISVFKKYRQHWIIFTYNVGDGAISLVNSQGGFAAVLCNPDEGKYFGETRFVTTDGITAEENVQGRILVNLVRDFDALILMTDGVSDPKFESDRNLHDSRRWLDFYRELSSEVQLYGCNDELESQMLEYLNFWSIGNHDDRTMVVVF